MISIIGAGPAGNYSAYLLAKAGKEVNVYEEHSCIGKPVQCTGLVTSIIEDIIKVPKEIISNRLSRVRIYAPNNEFIEVNFKKKNIVLDREKFDCYLADLAQKAGAKYFFNKKFRGCIAKNNKTQILFGKEAKETDYLIGADGPFSQVAKSSGLYGKREFMRGIQVRIEHKSDPDVISFYPGIGDMAWSVPESSEIARVGVISKNLVLPFKILRTKYPGKILAHQGGPIPIYNPKLKTQKGNIFLLGDAATMIKASSHGGILQGLMAAEELSKAILEDKNYERLWKKRLGFDLWLHLKIRHMLSKFSAEDYNKLVSLFKKDKLKIVLEEHERDYVSRFAFKLLLKEPQLIKYLFKAF